MSGEILPFGARPMPANEVAERSVLGACMVDSAAFSVAQGVVGPEDWYLPVHGALWRLMADLVGRGVALDLVTVCSEVQHRGAERFGGAGYVAGLPEHCVSSANVGYHADLVRQSAVRRRALERLRHIEAAIRGEGDPRVLDPYAAVDDLVARAGAYIADLSTPVKHRVWTVAEAVHATEEEGLDEEAPPAIFGTGIYGLDQLLGGGLRPGELVTIGGAPSMGKSALALWIGFQTAKKGARTLYYSLEPQRSEWSQRVLSLASSVPMDEIRRPKERSSANYLRTTPAELALRETPLRFVHRPGASLLDVGTEARRQELGAGVDVLIVDYLQLMRHERAERQDLRVAATTAGLKALAGELGCAVVLLSQLNRESQRDVMRRGDEGDAWWRRVRLPSLADLRDSGSIEQDSDVVLFPVQAGKAGPQRTPAPGTSERDAVVVLAKQRNGPTGVVPVLWDGPCATYRDEVVDPNGPV